MPDALFVSTDTTVLTPLDGSSGRPIELLWGDRVTVLSSDGTNARVTARGLTGNVSLADLGQESLLELYFIDVGQGDGILIRTPDHRHILIDGGFKRTRQVSGKNAADFVDWKFFKDYAGKRTGDDGSDVEIVLDAMIASHCDADHYGGLWDLLNQDPDARQELDAQGGVRLGAFYHAGVGFYRRPNGGRFLGREVQHQGRRYLTRLMGDRTDVTASLQVGAADRLQGEWAQFMESVTATGCPIQRLSHRDRHLPGFGPGTIVPIRVLAPVEYEVNGQPALRDFGADSQTTNGNSLVLRLDYGKTRILLTGDLNRAAQNSLIEAYQTGPASTADNLLVFQCDVAKGCHHGSDDVSFRFLDAMRPAATVISSGDDEGHGHPRPSIMAASGLTGHLQIENDRVVTPLVYSTEIARSYRLGRVTEIRDPNAAGPADDVVLRPADNARVQFSERRPGAIKPATKSKPFDDQLNVVSGLIYGLVNVRTDGRRVLCATLNEEDSSWSIRTFTSRF